MYTYPRSLDPTYWTGHTAAASSFSLKQLSPVSIATVDADALTNPTKLLTSHDVRTIGGLPVAGHLVRLEREYTTSLGKKVIVSASLVLKVPQDAVVTADEVKLVAGLLADACLTNTKMDQLLANEV